MEEVQSFRETGSQGGSALQSALTDGAICEQLERILASLTFRGSDAQKRFLRYAVQQTLEGNRDLIKEYSVGIQVFGRGESFDPRVDPIVRIQAGKLRSRLARYYAGEGSLDALRIEIPKGSYAPVFSTAGLQAEIQPAAADPALSASSGASVLQDDGAEASFAADASGSLTEAGTFVSDRIVSRRPLVFGRARALAFTIGAVLLGAGLAAYVVNLRRARPGPAPAAPPSVAVLRFANLSADQDDDVFIAGLTEQVNNSLARVPGLRVVARSSAFQYRSGIADIRKVGKDLRVGTVVEGSVQRSGGRLRVTAELEDTITGYELWSASYDRNVDDTSAIKQEISGEIAHTLGVQLAGSGVLKAESGGGRTKVDPEAYQDYLQGRYYLGRDTPESLTTAIGYFERAIAKDPNYAPDYTALATCYVKLPAVTATPTLAVIPKIKAAASRALELDSALGEAHLDLALAFMYDFDWSSAQEEFSKALELEPENTAAHHAYGGYLARMGRLREALAQHQIGLDLDPGSAFSAQQVARSLYFLRRYDDAIARFQSALALNVNSGAIRQGLGRAYFEKAMYPQGIQETVLAQQLMEGDPVTTTQLAYGYAVSGKKADAQRLLTGLIEQSNRGSLPALGIARLYIGLGDKDNAFSWLRRAVKQHNVNLFLIADPVYDALRSDSRFAELLRQMGLNPDSAVN